MRWTAFLAWPLILPQGDTAGLIACALMAILGQAMLAWLVLAQADRERFAKGDFWVAAAWLSFGALVWLPLPYAWSLLTTPVFGWTYIVVTAVVSSASLWFAEERQGLSPSAAGRLLNMATILCGVAGAAMILYTIRGGPLLPAIFVAPLGLWAASRFSNRLRDGRQVR